MGAFEGIFDEEASTRPWSAEAKQVTADDEQVQTGLRAYFEAYRLKDDSALIPFARLTRQTPQHQPLAAKLLREKKSPSVGASPISPKRPSSTNARLRRDTVARLARWA